MNKTYHVHYVFFSDLNFILGMVLNLELSFHCRYTKDSILSKQVKACLLPVH